MDDPITVAYRRAMERAITAFNAGNQLEALKEFEGAIALADRIPDAERQRSAVRHTALTLVRGQFARMGRSLAKRAVELDERANQKRDHAQDLLTLGWASLQLREFDDADTAFAKALDVALANGDYDTAAGASTNLAIVIGARGFTRPPATTRAIKLLRDSLRYLERRGNGEFEITTRVALIQALEAERADPAEVFEVARALYDRFSKQLRKDQWDNTLGPLRQALSRHVETHPGLDRREWMRAKFPELL